MKYGKSQHESINIYKHVMLFAIFIFYIGKTFCFTYRIKMEKRTQLRTRVYYGRERN